MLGRVQLGHRSFLRKPNCERLAKRIVERHGIGIRCVLDPRLAASSINSVIATASGSTTHSGVASAIAQVAVTAVAIASGACLSTKVEFLWPKAEDLPDSLVLDGVDVTGWPIFTAVKVQKAIAFARKAHSGQFRKTGEPYLSHCVHTGKILAALVPAQGERAINTVVAGILHDVIDDARENLRHVEEEFGDDVARLVAGVSRLSYINQLLRRHRRTNVNRNDFLSAEEANNLRVMLLGMVDDPRMVLIKLADRLHNMRTIYALPPSKARAVAEETLAIWCSLASRLGVWAVKAELEDLSFAVLQPSTFRQMRAELAAMWTPSDRPRNSRRMTSNSSVLMHFNDKSLLGKRIEGIISTDEDEVTTKDLLQAVLPFDLLLDRRKRNQFIDNASNISAERPKVVCDAGIALASLSICEEALEKELFISIPYVPGMEVTLSSRLKSLYSIYCKMKRKGVGIRQVYDARALRVVVGDKNGTLHGAAVKCCYSLLNTVHRLWTPIDGEFDDYIINPKPSGYQSLHTAVQGPDYSPLEVQIRTQRMHEYAEYGLAAHWLYKEEESKKGEPFLHESNAISSSLLDDRVESDKAIQVEGYEKLNCVKVGHPVLRVDGSHLLAAVIISVEKDGSELLVAVSFGLGGYEVLADRRSKLQGNWWEAYANLYKKASDQWWFAPGHGDWSTCLERYKLCRDGIYHKLDQFQRLLSTFIQVIDLTEEEEAQYWRTIYSIDEEKPATSETSVPYVTNKPSFTVAAPLEVGINSKVHLLRTMLKWEEQMHQEGVFGQTKQRPYLYGGSKSNTVVLDEVAIICWPNGEIVRMRSRSTAADVAVRMGLEGNMVFINGQLVLPDTELTDGDIVEVRT